MILKLDDNTEKKIGAITVPANNDLYTEATVMAVGPGSVAAGGGVPDTFDLKVGQRVFVQHKEWQPEPLTGKPTKKIIGVEYRDGENLFYMFDQHRILGIIPTMKSVSEVILVTPGAVVTVN